MIAAGRPWFRFVQGAGNKLLDSCVLNNSCGTYIPLWSNATMPSTVGNATSIQVYGHYTLGCMHFRLNASVMRCSWDSSNDFIYRYDDSAGKGLLAGFCGMNA